MAAAVDASSPARWAGTATFASVDTSASFTAPADALLVVCLSYDTTSSAPGTLVGTCSDSGALTWAKKVERTALETTAGGGAAIFTARTTSSAARTVSVGYNEATGGTGTSRKSAKLYVITGVDVDGTPVDTVGASNEGGSATNSLTTSSLTPGATGLLIAVDCEWNALGTFDASSDLTQDTAHYASQISVCSGYKVCTSGVGVTANLNAGGAAAAQHKWCQIIVRAAAGGGGAGIAVLDSDADMQHLDGSMAFRREEHGLFVPDRRLLLPSLPSPGRRAA